MTLAADKVGAAESADEVPGEARLAWFSRWSLRLAEYGAAQVLVQACLAVTGFLIVRSLPKGELALFAIVNSMQVAANLLADLGVGIGLRSIGGRVWHDPERFGRLINTALSLRRQFAAISLAVTVPLAGWMLWRNGASWPMVVGLCLCVVATVVPQLGLSVHNVALQLHGRYRHIQRHELAQALVRGGLVAGLAAVRFNALLAAGCSVAAGWVQYLLARRWTRGLADGGAPVDEGDRRDLLRLSWQSAPNVIFFCLQAQVTLLILAWSGNPARIADFSAVGRISALFAVFGAVFVNLLAPRFARCQDAARLSGFYWSLVGLTVAVLAPVVVVAWIKPGALLWVLGVQYSGLDTACGWVVTTGCVGQVVTVMWNLNGDRTWIRFRTLGYIPSVLLAQLLAVRWLDLQQFNEVLIFNFVVIAAPLPVLGLDAWWGLREAHRSLAVPARTR